MGFDIIVGGMATDEKKIGGGKVVLVGTYKGDDGDIHSFKEAP